MADSPSDSAASWSAVRKTSASGGCAVMTPQYGVARVRVGSLKARPVRLRPISRASTRPDRTAPVMSRSLPECTRSWKRHIRSRARGSSRDRDGGPRRPAGRAAGVRLRARTAPHPRPGVTEGPRREAGAGQGRSHPAGRRAAHAPHASAPDRAGDRDPRAGTREDGPRPHRGDGSRDAAVDRVAAADAELASLMPEVRARLARLYRLMLLGYDRLLFSLEDARTFDRAAREVGGPGPPRSRAARALHETVRLAGRRGGPPPANATRWTC